MPVAASTTSRSCCSRSRTPTTTAATSRAARSGKMSKVGELAVLGGWPAGGSAGGAAPGRGAGAVRVAGAWCRAVRGGGHRRRRGALLRVGDRRRRRARPVAPHRRAAAAGRERRLGGDLARADGGTAGPELSLPGRFLHLDLSAARRRLRGDRLLAGGPRRPGGAGGARRG